MTVAEATRARLADLHHRGWATVPDVLQPATVAALLEGVRSCWRDRGKPALFSQDDVIIDSACRVSPVGMSLFGAAVQLPEMTAILRNPALLELLQAALGPALEVELSAAILADSTRPFFFWHNHVGGIDGEDYRDRHDLTFERVERVAITTYLTPLDDDHGVMMFAPRALGDPIAPPRVPDRAHWPEEVPQRCAAGTTVVIDQATWHAVTPMAVQGQRAFVSFFVRRAGLAPSRRRDASVAAVLAADPQLVGLYAAAPFEVRA